MGEPRLGLDCESTESVQDDRFVVHRRLGSGGFGVVYEALDLRYGSPVALKVLYQDNPDALYRFKNEFRVLADITHANLVMLHELLYDRDRWLLSMELVEGGVHFLDSFRRDDGSAPSSGEGLLRVMFLELVHGVRALHAANVLHADLKPSNVLVTPGGRVVLLDFGLAKELLPRRPCELPWDEACTTGTPAYIAPEQILGETTSEASDWYSVGTMLYEGLTGQLPFQGNTEKVLRDKLYAAPTSPLLLADDVPEDLALLCMGLLRRDRRARPAGEEIERCLRGEGPPRVTAIPERRHEAGPGCALLGRAREMSALHSAFEASREGRAVLARVAGGSGMGKSALASAFAESLHRRESVIVLMGACHDRESVPYKALDSVVDALARYLKRLPPAEVAALLPKDVHELTRLFPVLQIVAGTGPSTPRGHDPQLERRRAFHVLKQLLGNLARARPVVICIDDLHWGDVDSAHLLAELLSPPEAPPLLVVACYRSDDAERSACLRELGRLLSAGVEIRAVPVSPLPPEQARSLATERLAPVVDVELAATIARESEGNPFAIEELCRYVAAGVSGDPGRRALASGGLTLRSALRARLDAAPPSSRRLLEVVAVAGRPLEQEVAFEAAELGDGALLFLTPLRSAKLLRVASVRERLACEVVHARIRDAVLSGLGPEALAARHHRLATALEASDQPEPEELAMHYHGAGERRRAAAYAALAGDRANDALAFDRAADLYALALEWGADGPFETPEERHDLLVRRAHALANAGRCREAAELYLVGAEEAPRAEALDLRRRAIQQLFVGGHLDEGNRVLAPFLSEVGLPYRVTTARAVLEALAQLASLRVRGYHFEARSTPEIPPEVLTRVDVCWAVSLALTDVDPVRSFGFQIRGLRMAIEAGEPRRIALGLSAFAQLTLLRGTKGAVDEGMRLLAQAERIAAERGNEELRASVGVFKAAMLLIEGRWSEALARYDEIGRYLRERGVSPVMDPNLAEVISVVALDAMGRLPELAERTAAWHRKAASVGNLFAAIVASIASAHTLIAADDPEGARRRVREGISRWTHGMHVQHVYALRVEIYADLYAGRADVARARLEGLWRAIVKSQLLRPQPSRIDVLTLRGRTAIACAAAGDRRRPRLLREATRIAERLERELRRDARPTAALLRAAVALLRGRRDLALAHLDTAVRGFDAAEMSLSAACARHRMGELLGGEAGAVLVAEAHEVMRKQGIQRPERWLVIFAPGFGVEEAYARAA
nr:serine/threonine-protein kinase [Polyangium spumosum]